MQHVYFHDLFTSDISLVDNGRSPLGFGIELHLLTNHPCVLSRRDAKYFAQVNAYEKELKRAGFGDACAFHASWSDISKTIIYISHVDSNSQFVSPSRICALVAHEVSHFVDHLLARASVQTVDTEIRAYMMDYYVELIMQEFCFVASEPRHEVSL